MVDIINELNIDTLVFERKTEILGQEACSKTISRTRMTSIKTADILVEMIYTYLITSIIIYPS